MLADLGRDVDLAPSGQRIEPVNRILRLDDLGRVLEREAVLAAPCRDLRPPLGERWIGFELLVLPQLDHRANRARRIGDDGKIDADVLVDLRAIDVEVDFLRVGRERIQPPGHPIVEARTQRDHEPLLVGCGERAQAHQGRGDRKTGQVHQLAQQPARLQSRIDDAAARIDHGPLRLCHHANGCANRALVGIELRSIGPMTDITGTDIGTLLELHVLGNIDDNGPRAAGGRDVERLVDDARQIVHVAHQPIVLGAGARDADGVAFLKRVIADEMGRHLSGNDHERNRIHQRVGQARDRIGRSRPRGDKHDARLAGRARIAFGGVNRALFVTHQHVDKLVVLEQGIVNRQHRAARIAEDVAHALILERADHDLRTGQFHFRGLCRRRLFSFRLAHTDSFTPIH